MTPSPHTAGHLSLSSTTFSKKAESEDLTCFTTEIVVGGESSEEFKELWSVMTHLLCCVSDLEPPEGVSSEEERGSGDSSKSSGQN